MLNKVNLHNHFYLTLLVSIVLTFTACGSMHIHPGDDLQLLHEKTFDTSPGKNLSADLSSGDITITYWDKDQVYIKVFANENAFEEMDFSTESNDGNIEIVGRKKSSTSSWFSNLNVLVEVKVPTKFNLDINTAGGDIKCGGINGTAKLNTSGGDVWADKFSGNLDASTSGGDIHLYCKDASINAETSGGDIKLEYSGENIGIELSTSGGDIDIKIPEDFKASIDLSTSGGDVSCSLELSNTIKSYDSSLSGDLNGGGKMLIAHTSGGDISVSEK